MCLEENIGLMLGHSPKRMEKPHYTEEVKKLSVAQHDSEHRTTPSQAWLYLLKKK